MNVIYDTKCMWQNDTLPKTKHCAEYTLIYIHYLVLGTGLEISNKMKKIKRKEIMRLDLQQLVETMAIDNW